MWSSINYSNGVATIAVSVLQFSWQHGLVCAIFKSSQVWLPLGFVSRIAFDLDFNVSPCERCWGSLNRNKPFIILKVCSVFTIYPLSPRRGPKFSNLRLIGFTFYTLCFFWRNPALHPPPNKPAIFQVIPSWDKICFKRLTAKYGRITSSRNDNVSRGRPSGDCVSRGTHIVPAPREKMSKF